MIYFGKRKRKMPVNRNSETFNALCHWVLWYK